MRFQKKRRSGMTQVISYSDRRNRDAMCGEKETRMGLTLRLVHATRSAGFYPIDLGHLLKSSWIEESGMEEINLGWRDESGSLLVVFKSAVSFSFPETGQSLRTVSLLLGKPFSQIVGLLSFSSLGAPAFYQPG